ncbi:Hypothetical predicted protein [Mytilus galloprovincialis]|uniref:DNA-directed DNA polymerase n=1 Tax=Mytilus galloprovincialis TaxID=29158 RepID=A0A8B6FNB5_MYTGA|nr:Hypothetical predicted protein [Mytilus galloprovincialis]
MEKEMWKIYNIYKEKKDMVMTEEDEKRHETSMTCHICSKDLNGDMVRDHDHITGKYRGAAHSKCNLAFQLPKFVPIVFHNLSGYDADLFVKELGFNGGQINCIPITDEKYISFSKKVGPIEMRFIDSCRFMPNSLDTLVKNLMKDQFKNTKEVFNNEHYELLLRKGVCILMNTWIVQRN